MTERLLSRNMPAVHNVTDLDKKTAFEWLRAVATDEDRTPRVQRLAAIALAEWHALKTAQPPLSETDTSRPDIDDRNPVHLRRDLKRALERVAELEASLSAVADGQPVSPGAAIDQGPAAARGTTYKLLREATLDVLGVAPIEPMKCKARGVACETPGACQTDGCYHHSGAVLKNAAPQAGGTEAPSDRASASQESVPDTEPAVAAPDNVGDSDRWQDPRDLSGGETDAPVTHVDAIAEHLRQYYNDLAQQWREAATDWQKRGDKEQAERHRSMAAWFQNQAMQAPAEVYKVVGTPSATNARHWVYAAAEAHRDLVLACQDPTSTEPVKAGHLWWMLDQIRDAGFSPTKACRWLGWIQACLCWYSVATLEELKQINLTASGSDSGAKP